jgi:hypothetical protein
MYAFIFCDVVPLEQVMGEPFCSGSKKETLRTQAPNDERKPCTGWSWEGGNVMMTMHP